MEAESPGVLLFLFAFSLLGLPLEVLLGLFRDPMGECLGLELVEGEVSLRATGSTGRSGAR
jgi:hypothetical protein